jgi:hypothetical protein
MVHVGGFALSGGSSSYLLSSRTFLASGEFGQRDTFRIASAVQASIHQESSPNQQNLVSNADANRPMLVFQFSLALSG